MLLKGQVSDGTDNEGKRSLAQAEGLWTYCASFSDCVQPSDCCQIINCQTVLNRQTVGRQTALHSRHPIVELSANCRPSAKSQVVVRTDYCMYIYRLIQSKHSLTTKTKTGDQTYPVRYLSNVFRAIWMHIFFFRFQLPDYNPENLWYTTLTHVHKHILSHNQNTGLTYQVQWNTLRKVLRVVEWVENCPLSL